MPTGNQFNIIAERMYPTKEGYTALLKRLGVKYIIDVSYDKGNSQNFAEIPVKINADNNGEKISMTILATVKKDSYSSPDQLRGKAERRAKKALYEYVTGHDAGDADEDSSRTIDAKYEDVTWKPEASIIDEVYRCETIESLTKLYESIPAEERSDELIRLFTARKSELK